MRLDVPSAPSRGHASPFGSSAAVCCSHGEGGLQVAMSWQRHLECEAERIGDDCVVNERRRYIERSTYEINPRSAQAARTGSYRTCRNLIFREEIGRGGGTRTLDFLLPKQALYQAELRPDELEDHSRSGVVPVLRGRVKQCC